MEEDTGALEANRTVLLAQTFLKGSQQSRQRTDTEVTGMHGAFGEAARP